MNTDKKLFILFSGKRKCGKDFLTEKLYRMTGETNCEIIRISKPIKEHWSKLKQLNLDELLSDGPYKEQYRKEMILWSDEIRKNDSGFFCREAVKLVSKPVVIVSDIRRKTDIEYFTEMVKSSEHYKMITVRIECNEMVRQNRGYTFQDGIDNVASECDLDDYDQSQFDLILSNNTFEDADRILERIRLYCADYYPFRLS